MRLLSILFTVVLSAIVSKCCTHADTTQMSASCVRDTILLDIKPADKVIIDTAVNLNYHQLILPEGVSLVFKGNGRIENGYICGNRTYIEPTNLHVFKNVKISGTWNVPIVRSSMFVDIERDHLPDLFKLCSGANSNKVFINPGRYIVICPSEGQSCMVVPSNTDVSIDGTIELAANSYDAYNILYLNGDNISFHGTGTIVGDRKNHEGKTGEWGHGVCIGSGKGIIVSGLNIKDCWGDCVYVRGEGTEAVIKDCKLSNSRRQGVTITKAKKVNVANCRIEHIGGTAPGYAIDIESNKDDVIETIGIDHVYVSHCNGGIKSSALANGSRINTISVTNCRVLDSCHENAYEFIKTDRLVMSNCFACDGNNPILLRLVDDAKLTQNKISGRINNRIVEKCTVLVDR